MSITSEPARKRGSRVTVGAFFIITAAAFCFNVQVVVAQGGNFFVDQIKELYSTSVGPLVWVPVVAVTFGLALLALAEKLGNLRGRVVLALYGVPVLGFGYLAFWGPPASIAVPLFAVMGLVSVWEGVLRAPLATRTGLPPGKAQALMTGLFSIMQPGFTWLLSTAAVSFGAFVAFGVQGVLAAIALVLALVVVLPRRVKASDVPAATRNVTGGQAFLGCILQVLSGWVIGIPLLQMATILGDLGVAGNDKPLALFLIQALGAPAGLLLVWLGGKMIDKRAHTDHGMRLAAFLSYVGPAGFVLIPHMDGLFAKLVVFALGYFLTVLGSNGFSSASNAAFTASGFLGSLQALGRNAGVGLGAFTGFVVVNNVIEVGGVRVDWIALNIAVALVGLVLTLVMSSRFPKETEVMQAGDASPEPDVAGTEALDASPEPDAAVTEALDASPERDVATVAPKIPEGGAQVAAVAAQQPAPSSAPPLTMSVPSPLPVRFTPEFVMTEPIVMVGPGLEGREEQMETLLPYLRRFKRSTLPLTGASLTRRLPIAGGMAVTILEIGEHHIEAIVQWPGDQPRRVRLDEDECDDRIWMFQCLEVMGSRWGNFPQHTV